MVENAFNDAWNQGRNASCQSLFFLSRTWSLRRKLTSHLLAPPPDYCQFATGVLHNGSIYSNQPCSPSGVPDDRKCRCPQAQGELLQEAQTQSLVHAYLTLLRHWHTPRHVRCVAFFSFHDCIIQIRQRKWSLRAPSGGPDSPLPIAHAN